MPNRVATNKTTWSFMIDQEGSGNEFTGETALKVVGFIRSDDVNNNNLRFRVHTPAACTIVPDETASWIGERRNSLQAHKIPTPQLKSSALKR